MVWSVLIKKNKPLGLSCTSISRQKKKPCCILLITIIYIFIKRFSIDNEKLYILSANKKDEMLCSINHKEKSNLKLINCTINVRNHIISSWRKKQSEEEKNMYRSYLVKHVKIRNFMNVKSEYV